MTTVRDRYSLYWSDILDSNIIILYDLKYRIQAMKEHPGLTLYTVSELQVLKPFKNSKHLVNIDKMKRLLNGRIQ